MARAFIALGSNQDDRSANFKAALGALRADPRVVVRQVSSFHETRPEGGPPQRSFLNAAAELETTLSPRELLKRLLDIENALGRKRSTRWGSRTIDLDLLLYEEEIVQEEGLSVPHPRMHERAFVLQPLAEIAPNTIHPISKKTIRQLLQEVLHFDG